MKLWLLNRWFHVCLALCKVTTFADRVAQRMHQAAWRSCTATNLKTCNTRQAARTRFC